MQTRILFLGILLTAFVVSPAAPAAAEEPAEKARMLMVTQSRGYRHRVVARIGGEPATAEVAMQKLGEKTGLFTADVTQDCAADFTRENLDNYDIVAFYTTGKLPIAKEDMDYFLEDWLKQTGHGFIGIHSATDTFKNFRPYWEMIGGTFAGHPWGASSTVTLTVHDPEHPAMQPFEREFEFEDEIYRYVHWQPEKVRVLMSLDMAKTRIKRPYHVPVAWVKEWGEGKVFYTNLGHRSGTWEDERFLKSITGAVRWITGAANGSAAPNPEVSRQQERKARAAAE